MTNGFQPNGLPSTCKPDTVTAHDWAHTEEWPGDHSDSAWDLVPAAGEAIKVTGVQITYSEKMIVPVSSAHIIEGIIEGWAGSPYKLSEYVNMRAFLKRADTVERIPYDGPSGGDVNSPIMILKFDFSQPPCLWSSGGVDGGNPLLDNLGIPRWQKMRCRIADNIPYKDDSQNPVQIACSRYFIERYEDPFAS